MSTSVYDARGGMRNVWIITASMTVLAICYTMIIPFLPIYLLELGVPKADVALWSGLVFGITFLLKIQLLRSSPNSRQKLHPCEKILSRFKNNLY